MKRDSLIRRVIAAGNNIAKEGYKSVSGTDALMNAEREIYSISEDISEKDLVHAGEALGAAMKDIQDVQAGVVSTTPWFTDFPSMDRMFHGLKPGELILIAARPSVGKTAFALNIAANVCLHHNKTVAIFSLESRLSCWSSVCLPTCPAVRCPPWTPWAAFPLRERANCTTLTAVCSRRTFT